MTNQMDNNNNGVFYEIILKARIRIARMGEKDIFNWWDAEAQSEGGLFALKRLFKNTYYWAAMEVSMRAAMSKIDGLLKEGTDYFHLFNLIPELDSKVWDLFFQLKRENKNHNSYFFEINDENKPFNKIFQDFEISEDILEKMRKIQKDLMNPSVVVLGTLKKEELEKLEAKNEILKLLIAGFALGSNNKLIIPTYRII